MNDDQANNEPLEQLAESFLARLRAGEQPAQSEYEAKHPDLAADIRELFPALALMEQGRKCIEQQPAPDTARLAEAQVPRQLGEYRLLREVGRGGMGVVYEAYQESLGRHVALKVLPFNTLAQPEHLERFRREARAAARLHHTNIVPVFGVGLCEGIHYYAMQFINGQGLNAVIEEVRRSRGLENGSMERAPLAATLRQTPAPGGASSSSIIFRPEGRYFAGVASIGIQVAEALAYAHDQGVVHRDIKPANLLLDTAGRIWVTDFGLAKADDSAVLTQPGDIVGTVRYMAPERFQEQGDARSDVYGLGITLYELLTLRPAFEAPNRGVLMEQIARLDPPRPGSLDRRIPRDLETIVLKATVKEPGRRYQSAAALAEDLRSFLADRPIRARRTSRRERLWRWCRRNPVVAGLASLAAFLLLIIASGIGWVAYEGAARQAALDAEVNRAMDEADTLISLQEWTDARAAVERGEKLLAAAGHEVPAPMQELRKDLTMVLTLEDIHSRPKTEDFFTGREQERAYDQAFKSYGMDLAHLPVADAAGRIRARGIRLELARALDFWSSMRRRAGTTGAPDWKQLLAIARGADPDPWRNRLRTALEHHDRQVLEALAQSKNAGKLPPETLHLLGIALSAVGAPEQAAALLRTARREHPGDLWINDALGWLCLNALRQYDEAIRFYTAAQAVRPRNPYMTFCIGQALADKARFPEAIAEFTKALERKPDFEAALCARAHALLKIGERDKALGNYAGAIGRNPESAWAWFARGQAYEELREWSKALDDYTKAIGVDPNFTLAWNHRAYVHCVVGQWNLADADYAKVVEIAPTYVYAWFQSAYLRLQVGDAKGYRQLCAGMRARFGQSANVDEIACLAHACALAPQAPPDARWVQELAEKRLKLTPPASPHYLWSLHVLGLAYYRAGLHEKAMEVLRKGVDEFPNWQPNVGNMLVLAMAHERLKHPTEARQWLERARQSMPPASGPELAEASDSAPLGWEWLEWLGFQLLHREAEELLSAG